MAARLLVLDVVDNEGFYEKECDDLQDYYDALKCDCFDIATRQIVEIDGESGKVFDIFCDDNGLFAENPIPSALDDNMQVALVGNLIFANHDNMGNTTSLSDEDIDFIKRNAISIYDALRLKGWTAVINVCYPNA